MYGPGIGYMPDYMNWMMLGTWVFLALVFALGLVVLLRIARPADAGRNPKQMLDERLARGDIDPEEYRSRLALLKA